MSISSILQMAQSALQTAQTQVQVTSENVSNVDTAGYSRKVANQQDLASGGVGQGVNVVSIQNVANQFLQQANLSATAQSGQASVISNLLDQASNLFGDPSSSSSFFSSLDNVYSAFSTASDTPSSSLLRQSALDSVSSFLQTASDTATSLNQLQAQTGQQISTDVTTVNSVLGQISQLNTAITSATLSGGDATGAQDQQNQLLSKLAGLMNIQVQPTATGGVTVRSTDGVYLAGDLGASKVNFSQSGSAAVLTATPPSGAAQTIKAGGGDIGGLLQLGQVDLPQISAQLGQYVNQAVNQLNQASNASSAVPAPATLTGRDTGMALSTAVGGFTGKTTVAVVNSAGVIQQKVAIDFSAGTMSVNGGTSTSFTPANFLSSLNTALGSSATASFTNGALSISAASGGVAIADDATSPAANASQGFSQFFGLNDLVTSSGNTDYATGLSTGDPNTFSGTLTLQLSDATGASVRQANITIPTGGTVGAMIGALNAGVGSYGSFSLDSDGELSFTPSATNPASVSVASDNTTNSVGGGSISQMFGIGDATRAAQVGSYSVAQTASTLAFAQLNLSAAAGTPALASGDGSGALAMAQSGAANVAFSAGGGLAAMNTTVSNYGSEISGLIASKASTADTAAQTATATATQAASQLSSATGVNLDQELVNLTTYQQAYSASARLIQAATTMYDSLLQMVPG
jgi:flagellar hook-associated protein 1 FlgK